MSRTRAYPRRQFRRLFRAWLKKKAGPVALLAGFLVVLAIVLVWWVNLFAEGRAWHLYVLGAIHAAMFVAVGASLAITFLVQEGTAIHQLRGAWGEEFTRDELKKARRKKLVWGWADSIDLQRGDIDHLVVTRNGGVVALDSKWRSAATDDDRRRIVSDAKSVKLRATGVVQTHLKKETGRHRSAGRHLQVTVAVVVWGALADHVRPDLEVDGVAIVKGHDLVSWLKERDGEAIDRAAARELLGRIESGRMAAAS